MRISGNDTLSRLGNQDKDTGLAIAWLERIIQEKEAALEEYARKQGPKANQAYIERENKYHLELRGVHAQIYPFHYQPIWVHLEEAIRRLDKYDPCLTGMTVELRIKPGPDKFTYFNFDLY